jgi:dUTP pyrophosphatase
MDDSLRVAPPAGVTVELQRIPGTEDLPLPSYKTENAAGMDLYAAVTEPLTLEPGGRAAVPTGIAVAVPPGYEAQVRARSGSALHYGIGLTNGVGTIDADYRGQIYVLIINHGETAFTIGRGDRIAQLVIAPVLRVAWKVVPELDATERGAGGFGHTGR